MIKVGGTNKFSQLIEMSSVESSDEVTHITVPTELKIDVSKLLSFSVYCHHSVWVTLDFRGHTLGDNREGRVSATVPFEINKQEKEFCLEDAQGTPINIVSAVCGYYYTLYLVSRQDGFHLAFVHRGHNESNAIILNLNGRHPVAIFGGWETAAAIGKEGEIFIITESSLNDTIKAITPYHLPDCEKAVSVACCSRKIIILGSKGRVFSSALTWNGSLTEFDEIDELRSKNIVDISGTFKHVLAVSKEGKVFGSGENEYGKLGIGKDIPNTKKFVEITDLKDKIIHVYAGNNHSLFQTTSGKIIACGKNNLGQLLLENGPSENVYSPIETSIKKDASFCIAGNCLSAVFVNADPPAYMPNKKIFE